MKSTVDKPAGIYILLPYFPSVNIFQDDCRLVNKGQRIKVVESAIAMINDSSTAIMPAWKSAGMA